MLVEIWLNSQIIVFCLQVSYKKTHIPSLFPILFPYPNVLYNIPLICLFSEQLPRVPLYLTNYSFLGAYESNTITDEWSHFKFMSTTLKWVHSSARDPTMCFWQVYSPTLQMTGIPSHLLKPLISLPSQLQFMVLDYSSLRKQKQMRTLFHSQICQSANPFCLSFSLIEGNICSISKTNTSFCVPEPNPFHFLNILQRLSFFSPILHLSLSTGSYPNMINISHLEKNSPLNPDSSH